MTDIELYTPAVTEARTAAIRQVEVALGKLAAHGTRSQIAAHLTESGHIGIVGVARSCPVARYLRAAVPEAEWVAVGRNHVMLPNFTGALPEAVAAFVRRFDDNDYPALISTEEVPPPF